MSYYGGDLIKYRNIHFYFNKMYSFYVSQTGESEMQYSYIEVFLL